MIQLWLSTSWRLNERSKKGKIMAPLSCSLSSGLAVHKQFSWIICQIFSLVEGPLRPCNSSLTSFQSLPIKNLQLYEYLLNTYQVQGTCDTKRRQDKHKWKSTCSRSHAWSRTNLAPFPQETGRRVLAVVKAQNRLRVMKSTTEYRNGSWGEFLFFRPISRTELSYQQGSGAICFCLLHKGEGSQPGGGRTRDKRRNACQRWRLLLTLVSSNFSELRQNTPRAQQVFTDGVSEPLLNISEKSWKGEKVLSRAEEHILPKFSKKVGF